MFSPVMTCTKCGGCGFSRFAGPFYVQCRRCDGTGVQMKVVAKIWSRIRYGIAEGQ